ncbi:MAG: hypothetical protein IIB22_03430 [Chloroflexi bacterium]|nr:hypothetical protein [Chloroflexota bacterium]MCH8162266.1 hypothetical protein [Chloroflexota bacterium]
MKASQMGMDNDFGLDHEEIIKTIESAEVLTFRFVVVGERLLFDTRSSEIDPPLVKLVPRARSVEDRFRALKQLRPRFKLPEKISAIWWPKSIESMVSNGVWGAIVDRVDRAGFSQAAEECGAVLEELRASERKELRNALTGEGYQSLWER